jgi:peptide/nickel transport system substrate-binding protein
VIDMSGATLSRTKIRRAASIAVLAALAAVAAACSAGSVTTQTAGGGSSSGSGGTLKWEWELPTSWDPVTSSAGWDVHVLSLAYSAITALDNKGNAIGGLAESWKYSADGRSITFKLRPGLRFSDGTPLDAAAVQTNILRGRDDPKSLIASQLAVVKSVDVTSPTSFTLELTQADYQIPQLLAGKTGMVVSPTAIKKGDTWLATHPVGDGPFTLTGYVPDSHADLTKNSGWYNAAKIKLHGVSVQAITDPQQILSALKTGDVNVAYIPGNLAASAKSAGFRIQSIPAMTVYTLDVKTTAPPFNDPKVVEAANYAIDRSALVKTQQFGYGTPAFQPFPKGYVGYDPKLANLYPHSDTKAKQLLKQAGYTSPVPIMLTTYSASSMAEQLQAQLNAGGFKVTLNVVPQDQATNDLYIKKSPEIALDSTAGRESPLQMLQVLYDKQGLMNLTAQGSPKVESSFAALQRVPLDSPNYRTALLKAVDAAATDPKAPHIWLFSYPRLFAVAPSVKNIPNDYVVQRFEGTQVTGS